MRECIQCGREYEDEETDATRKKFCSMECEDKWMEEDCE